jgi:hypothetical protein
LLLVKDDHSIISFTNQVSFLCRDTFDINRLDIYIYIFLPKNLILIYFFSMDFICRILGAGKLFNNHLSKLIKALKSSDLAIQTKIERFVNDPDLNVNISDDDLNIISDEDLSKWYHIANQACRISSMEIEGDFFKTTKRSLKNKIVAEKSLKHLNNNDTYLCVEKEIYLYHKHQFNNSDYIIKFQGYSVYNCKPMLFYDYAKYDDLFTYFRVNHKSLNLLKDWKEKIKLAWKITQGVKYLHDVRI